MNATITQHDREAGAVESVVIALHKVIGLLDRIKSAIEESSSKIPRASVQLATVTEATESATVEILNVCDTLTQKVTLADNVVNVLGHYVSTDEGAGALDMLRTSLREVQESTMTITLALQVQDITAQKIAAANHLIETVRRELLHELSYFEASGLRTATASVPGTNVADPTTFDRNASFSKPAEVQDRIDRVVAAWREQQVTQ